MFSQEQMQELLSYDGGNDGVVSLYLNTDGSQQPIETIKMQAKSMLRELDEGLQADAKRLEQYVLHEYDWSKSGLAAFSCKGGDFFQAFPVAVSFRNRVRTSHKPYVKPLTHLLDHYAHYGVILIDRVGARFFHFHLGELQETGGFMGEEVRKIKRGSGSSAIGMRGGQGGGRHEEEAMLRNLRDAAAAAGDFFAARPIRRLFLGGMAETVGQFREMLPKQRQSYIAGSFTMDMNASEHEVAKRTLAMLREANETRERKLVRNLVSAEASGNNAVLGLDDTLKAISDRRVQTLVISDGYQMPGYVHEESGYVVANLAKSPLSDKELTIVDDVIDVAVAQTMAQGGHVEVIADNTELERVGRIGAILRY